MKQTSSFRGFELSATVSSVEKGKPHKISTVLLLVALFPMFSQLTFFTFHYVMSGCG